MMPDDDTLQNKLLAARLTCRRNPASGIIPSLYQWWVDFQPQPDVCDGYIQKRGEAPHDWSTK